MPPVEIAVEAVARGAVRESEQLRIQCVAPLPVHGERHLILARNRLIDTRVQRLAIAGRRRDEAIVVHGARLVRLRDVGQQPLRDGTDARELIVPERQSRHGIVNDRANRRKIAAAFRQLRYRARQVLADPLQVARVVNKEERVFGFEQLRNLQRTAQIEAEAILRKRRFRVALPVQRKRSGIQRRVAERIKERSAYLRAACVAPVADERAVAAGASSTPRPSTSTAGESTTTSASSAESTAAETSTAAWTSSKSASARSTARCCAGARIAEPCHLPCGRNGSR